MWYIYCMSTIDQLLEYDRLAKKDGQKYDKKRTLYDIITKDSGDHFIGIVGPRGAGKTIILKQLALAHTNSFYLSLDTLEGNLFDLVKTLQETLRIELFLLDEVHFYPSLEADLKKIYDLLKVKIIFTSSTALGMYKSNYDLSRRVLLKALYPFTLREYADFKYDQKFGTLGLKDFIDGSFPHDILRVGEHFIPYIQGGLMPFALREPQPLVLLKNILDTIIHKDIPRIARLVTDELDKIEQLIRFIGLSGIDGINYSTVAHNLHISKYKAAQYISLLEKAFVLHQVFPKGSNVLKEPKVVMALPYRLLYRNFSDALGGLREDFFVGTFKALGQEVFYLKSFRGSKTPDYLLQDPQDIVFEVGGKGKGKSQFKGIDVCKKIILSDGFDVTNTKKPLFMLGLLGS